MSQCSENQAVTETSLKSLVGGSLVSKSILLMQKADRLNAKDSKAEKLLSKAVKTLRSAEEEENRWARRELVFDPVPSVL